MWLPCLKPVVLGEALPNPKLCVIFWAFEHPKSEDVAAPRLKPLVSSKAITNWAKQSYVPCSIQQPRLKPLVLSKAGICAIWSVSTGEERRELNSLFGQKALPNLHFLWFLWGLSRRAIDCSLKLFSLLSSDCSSSQTSKNHPPLYYPERFAPWKTWFWNPHFGKYSPRSPRSTFAKSFGNITSTRFQQAEHVFPVP